MSLSIDRKDLPEVAAEIFNPFIVDPNSVNNLDQEALIPGNVSVKELARSSGRQEAQVRSLLANGVSFDDRLGKTWVISVSGEGSRNTFIKRSRRTTTEELTQQAFVRSARPVRLSVA